MSFREENLNVMLAELLAERGLRALGELVLRRGDKRPEPDVLIELNGVRIVIEGKKPGVWNDLVRQCEERLDNNICDLCVMVEYSNIKLDKLMPSQLDIKNALLNGRFNVGFLSYVDRAGIDRWIGTTPKPEKYDDVGFNDLLAYIMSAYSRVVKEDVLGPVIERINNVLNGFAERVSSIVNVERLKEVLELKEKEGVAEEE
ncbi:MAG: hypothetical protein QXT26_03505 [Thermoproteota archaeon]